VKRQSGEEEAQRISKTLSYNLQESSITFEQWIEMKFGVQSAVYSSNVLALWK
jgi:hypothetical protein